MHNAKRNHISRRRLLQGAATLSAWALSGRPAERLACAEDETWIEANVIPRENALEGAGDWQLTRVQQMTRNLLARAGCRT